MASIKPTIFLIKDNVVNPDDIFKDATKVQKSSTSTNENLYWKKSPSNKPKWLPYIESHFTVDPTNFFNASSYAVVIIKEGGRFFAIPFGMGSHLIDMAKIEYNFGIKVAINSIPSDELRHMDMTSPESYSQKTKKHAVKNSTPEEMGINKQKDILRGLAGKLPNKHALGKSLEGKDSVRPTKKIDTIQELKDLCKELLKTSKETKYKKDYPWIDNMAIINDPVLLESLFSDLIKSLQTDKFDHMYLSTPELVEDFFKYEGFVFKGNKKRKKEVYLFPTMKDIVKDLGTKSISSMDNDSLRKTYKVSLRDDEGKDWFSWPLKRCIAWETEKNGKKYILSDGDWYQIASDFYTEVNDFFKKRVNDNLELPNADENYGKEADYNHGVCNGNNRFYLFDLGHPDAKTKTITKAGNEICDIFDSQKKRFIHVKPGKASTDISHLIRQGIFSALALKKEPSECGKFKGYLNDYGCPASLISDPYTPSHYIISYALILGDNQKKDIPFFSKVSFKDAVENNLEIMGYKCEFGYITQNKTSNNTQAQAS